ncbi:MAG: JAB domain-containing protein [Bacteroidetes bacterium]|nr:JAB domain-containing protein [Bacteroidota bacterium]MBU1372834.1 JAB domain-containing protein [Bacteroidota bacterium]MBU1485563.1 JAB domain-containing protein [Bacteroidota bacterium]MBU1760850.1 JAB domain-containing protein [Bacteroidota bacterium]MBU2045880.1 JAB domain-containing protein [Bacteroidota bacterium]
MEILNQHLNLFQVAEISLSYAPKCKASERPTIKSSNDVYQILKQNWDEKKIDLLEQFKVILMSRANKVLGIIEISSGGIAGTVADPKLIFASALKACASCIILAHNHPSGNLKPSQADIQLTRKIKAGGELLDITVLDHVILTSEGYYSFGDEGMI